MIHLILYKVAPVDQINGFCPSNDRLLPGALSQNTVIHSSRDKAIPLDVQSTVPDSDTTLYNRNSD